MTSKISFFKLMQEDLKRKLWLLVLAILVFFISFPVVLLIFLDNRKEYSYLSEELWKVQIKADFMKIMGYENIWMFIVTLVGATLCGIFAFSYLYKKQEVDFYHSIPIRREKLFLVSYLNGVLIYVIPYLVTILISMVIGGSYFTVDASVWNVALREFGLQVLFYLLIYHTTILASVLAGNMFGCLFLNGLAHSYTIFIYGIFVAYCGYFTTYTNRYENINEGIMGFSPIVAFYKALNRLLGGDAMYLLRLRDGEVSTKLYLMQVFLAAILLFGMAMYFYRIRSSEMSGKAIAFRKMQPVIRILLVIPSAMAGGWIFASLTSYMELGWILFGILFAAVLVHGVIEVLYQSDIRGMFSHKIQLIGTIFVAVGIVFIFRNDLFGYDTYVPKVEQMKSAAISIDGLANGNYYLVEDFEEGYKRMTSTEYQLEKMALSEDLLPVVWQLMNLGAESNRYNQTADNIVSFDLKVRLKNGKDVIRSYTVALDQAYPLLYEIFQSPEYKEKSYAYFFENYTNAVVWLEGLADKKNLSIENGIEFLEIYRKELLELSLDDVRDNPVIGRLECFILGEETKSRDFNMLLYPVMTESLQYLEKIGILDQAVCWVQPKAEEVEALQVWGAYMDRETEDKEPMYGYIKITDREQIEKLCKNLYFHIGNQNRVFWNESNYEFQTLLKPEVSQTYFDREEYQLDVVFHSFDTEDWEMMKEIIQKGERVE